MGKYKNEIDLNDEDFSNVLSFQALFLKEIKLMPIILSLIAESGKVGKSAKVLIDEIQKQYVAFKAQFEDEERFITNFLEKIENNVGSSNEMDSYSNMISELLRRVTAKFEKKSSVLVIDDLDRLDPEHIFRLFNIFSVNFGKDKVLNKFGFDKIIFVCDIENIKNIYKHKYGANVDFSGYIDKFYSISPYEFDNLDTVWKHIDQFIEALDDENQSLFGNEETRSDLKFHRFNFFKAFVQSLLNNRLLNLRTLLHVNHEEMESREFMYLKHVRKYSHEFPIITLFGVIKKYLGTYQDLKRILLDLEKQTTQKKFSARNDIDVFYDDPNKSLLVLCMPFLFDFDAGYDRGFETVDNKGLLSVKVPKFDCIIEFKDYGNEYFSINKVLSLSKGNEDTQINPFSVLRYTFEECVKRGAIRI